MAVKLETGHGAIHPSAGSGKISALAGSTNFSMSYWWRYDGLTAFSKLYSPLFVGGFGIRKDDSDEGSGFIGRIDTSTGIGNVQFTMAGDIETAVWYHFAISFDSTKDQNNGWVTIWYTKDGDENPTEASLAIDTYKSGVLGTIFDMTFLGNLDKSGIENLSIADVGLWSRSITASNVYDLSINKYSPSLLSDSLVANWSFTEPDYPYLDSVDPSFTISDDTNDGFKSTDHPSGIIYDVVPDIPVVDIPVFDNNLNS